MDFTTLTIELLKGLSNLAGGYGLAIVLLTVIMRLAMWPLGVSQQRSMRKMQILSPKLKELQNTYKSDPQMMQKKMMEFYKEHKFNPFGGCFPLLLQMPIFILLYSALNSPQFIDMAGNSSFLFIKRLDATMQSRSGELGNQSFGMEKQDTFSIPKKITVYTDKGTIKDVAIKHPDKAIEIQGQVTPGKPVDLKIKLDELDLSFDELKSIKKADISVINNATKEMEHLSFDKMDSLLVTKVKTENIKSAFHYDVFILVVLFGLTMFLSQKFMSGMTSTEGLDPAQKAMQEQMSRMMPIMITATFAFVPIPAGVLLYLVVSNIIQVIQTVIINKQLELEDANKPKNVTDNVPETVKVVQEKSTSKE